MDDQAANIEANTVIEAPPPDIEAPPAAVSVRDLMAWRDSAEDGASLVYHRRHAMKDRAKSPEVDAAVAGAWSLYVGGRALLTQRKRLGWGYEYICTAVSNRPVQPKL
jgi:hypothetical protein